MRQIRCEKDCLKFLGYSHFGGRFLLILKYLSRLTKLKHH
jgi:hypothetical protein